MQTKPRFTIVAGRPVQLPQRESPIEAARRRFGRRFAHEPGSDWKPQPELYLTRWLAMRSKEVK